MKKKFITLGIVFFSILGLLLLYRFYSLSTRNVVEKLIAQKRMINILVAGSNTYNENKHNFVSIVSINPENYKIGVTFLPPTLRIDLDGRKRNFRKLNEIDISDFGDLREAFERDFKLSVPFYIELYAVDVIRLVDLIEGIHIFMLDQVKGKDTHPFGLRYYDGKKIVEYMNVTENKSIFQKYDRVQDILLSLYNRKERYKKFLNNAFVTEALASVKTNIMPQEFMSLMRLVYNDSEVMCTTIPGEFDDKQYYITDEISYKIYEKEFLSKLFTADKGVSTLKVKILNGTDVPGLARKMRNLLIREGLNVVEFGNSPFPNLKRSVIVNQRGNISNVGDVAKLTGIKKVYNVIDNTQMHDLLIIIGKDFEK